MAELTQRQKEIRKEKNRITAKMSRDRKVAYIHNLESMLQAARTRIEFLEAELSIAPSDPAAQTPPPPPESSSLIKDDESTCSALDDLPMSTFDSDQD
jgi:hypothetical protein